MAGPLVIAAVILPKDVFISGLNDSKQLSAAKRDMLYNEVMAKALDIEVNIVSVSNIDELNIYSCLLYTSPSPRDPKTSRMPSSA